MSKVPDLPLWGIFGGSFDPPHIGHVSLVSNLIALTPLSGVVVVPSINHPLKRSQTTTDFSHRLHMTTLAFEGVANVIVSDVESRRSLTGFSIDTIRALKQEYAGQDWAFIIGSDLLSQFLTWHQPDSILREATLLVGSRPGHYKTVLEGMPSESLRVIETELVDVSSSGIRKVIQKSGLEAVRGLVPEPVWHYIANKRLYL